MLNGKPLIHYTIEEARKVFNDNIIRVSTDSYEIKKISENSGLKVGSLRPVKLAKDNTSAYDLIMYEISKFEKKHGDIEVVVFLQPTSPLRKAIHIKNVLNYLIPN